MYLPGSVNFMVNKVEDNEPSFLKDIMFNGKPTVVDIITYKKMRVGY